MDKALAAQYVLQWASITINEYGTCDSDRRQHEREVDAVFAALGLSRPEHYDDVPSWDRAEKECLDAIEHAAYMHAFNQRMNQAR